MRILHILYKHVQNIFPKLKKIFFRTFFALKKIQTKDNIYKIYLDSRKLGCSRDTASKILIALILGGNILELSAFCRLLQV